MNKLVIVYAMAVLVSSLSACADGEGEDITSEATSALTVGGHYCVSTSSGTAAGQFVASGGTGGAPAPPSNFCGSLNVTSQLSNGHPLKVLDNCGGHVFVQSLWNGIYYVMNAASLTPC
jgi:hypothetical protein